MLAHCDAVSLLICRIIGCWEKEGNLSDRGCACRAVWLIRKLETGSFSFSYVAVFLPGILWYVFRDRHVCVQSRCSLLLPFPPSLLASRFLRTSISLSLSESSIYLLLFFFAYSLFRAVRAI